MAALSPTPQSRSRRVFSDSDEILILKSLHRLNKKVNFSHSSSALSSAHKLLIFNRVNRISGTQFTQNQLNDKIRHLRRKYTKQSLTNASFNSRHDRRLFKLSGKIWGSNRISEQTQSENGAGIGEDCDQHVADKEEIEDVEKDENKDEEEEETEDGGEESKEREEENEENMVEEKQENGFVEGDDAKEDKPESDGGDNRKCSEEKHQVVLEKYPSLVSEFSRSYADNMVWREGFDCLGAEKLREMNDEWLPVRTKEAEIMATKFKLLEEQSKLLVEVFKSRSEKNWHATDR